MLFMEQTKKLLSIHGLENYFYCKILGFCLTNYYSLLIILFSSSGISFKLINSYVGDVQKFKKFLFSSHNGRHGKYMKEIHAVFGEVELVNICLKIKNIIEG